MSIPAETAFGARRSNIALPLNATNAPNINTLTAPPTRKATPLARGRVEEPRMNISTENRVGLTAVPNPRGIN